MVPVPDFLNLTFSNSNEEKQIEISDINGKILIQKKQFSNIVSVENLPKGIYIIQIMTDSKSYLSKFIKK